MLVNHVCERGRERLGPAAVVPDEVRLPVRGLRELLNRLIRGRRARFENAQIRGSCGRKRRSDNRAWGGHDVKTGTREAHGDRRDHESQKHNDARSHADLPPGKVTRLTTARLSKPNASSTANLKEPSVAIRHTASTPHSSAMPPLHHMTPIRKRGNELAGPRVASQAMDFPLAPSHIANT